MKTVFKIVKTLIVTTALIEIFNQINEHISYKKTCSSENSYKWKYGNISYKKEGKGSPILLIHNINLKESSANILELSEKLKNHYTVYSLDLLGCGNSDKPAIEYTNYIFVQLINDFIEKVIKEKTDVVSFHKSAPFVIMSASLNKENFGNLYFINPEYKKLPNISCITNKQHYIKQLIILPIYGTFVYYLYCKKQNIPFHKNTRYLHASQISNYVNIYTTKDISDLENNSFTFDDFDSTEELSKLIIES